MMTTAQGRIVDDGLPAHLFGEELDIYTERSLADAIKTTGDVATAWFDSHRKKLKNAETQSETMEKLFGVLHDRISGLEFEKT